MDTIKGRNQTPTCVRLEELTLSRATLVFIFISKGEQDLKLFLGCSSAGYLEFCVILTNSSLTNAKYSWFFFHEKSDAWTWAHTKPCHSFSVCQDNLIFFLLFLSLNVCTPGFPNWTQQHHRVQSRAELPISPRTMKYCRHLLNYSGNDNSGSAVGRQGEAQSQSWVIPDLSNPNPCQGRDPSWLAPSQQYFTFPVLQQLSPIPAALWEGLGSILATNSAKHHCSYCTIGKLSPQNYIYF